MDDTLTYVRSTFLSYPGMEEHPPLSPRVRTQFDGSPYLEDYCEVGGGVREVVYRCNRRHSTSPEAVIRFIQACLERTMQEKEDLTPRSMIWVVLRDLNGNYISTKFTEYRQFDTQKLLDAVAKALNSDEDYQVSRVSIKYL